MDTYSNHPPSAPALPPRNDLSPSASDLRLRTRDWGEKSESGWSNFNRTIYDELDFERDNIPPAPSSAGLKRTRNFEAYPLYVHDWGMRTPNGWSKFNRSRYYERDWEHKSAILSELSSQRTPRSMTTPPHPVITPTLVLSRSAAVPLSTSPISPTTIVPVNMLPPPINDGRYYERLISQNKKGQRDRKHLKQKTNSPTSSVSTSKALGNPLLLKPFTGRKARQASKEALYLQSGARSVIDGSLPAGMPLSHNGLPITNICSPVLSGAPTLASAPFAQSATPLRATKPSRRSRKSRNASASSFSPISAPASQYTLSPALQQTAPQQSFSPAFQQPISALQPTSLSPSLFSQPPLSSPASASVLSSGLSSNRAFLATHPQTVQKLQQQQQQLSPLAVGSPAF